MSGTQDRKRKACSAELSLASPRDGRALTLGKDMRERKCREERQAPQPLPLQVTFNQTVAAGDR